MALLKGKIRPSSYTHVARNLNKLIDKVARQGVREALPKAGRVMLKAAKAGVSKDRGNLKKVLKGKIKTYKNEGVIIYMMGSDRNTRGQKDGKSIRAERYAVVEEFGSKFRSGSGFMRKAFDSKKGEAFRIFTRELRASTQRAGKRLAKNFKG